MMKWVELFASVLSQIVRTQCRRLDKIARLYGGPKKNPFTPLLQAQWREFDAYFQPYYEREFISSVK